MERPAAMTQPTPAGEIPDLLYSEAEDDLRLAVRSLFSERAQVPDVLARTESGETYDTQLWHALAADLGCAGLLVPESLGGAGASYREAAVVAEETGRSVAPVPYLGSAVVATAALLAAAGPEPAAEADRKLLASLADGTVTAALAVPFESAPAPRLAPGSEPLRSVRVTGPSPGDPSGGPVRLAGDVARLADALPADVLLLCGIFGNVSDADIERTAQAAPALCAPGATVIWTRNRRAPDLTPQIRAWFQASGFDEVAFDVPDEALPGISVGVGRLAVTPPAWLPAGPVFTFRTA